MQRLFTIAINTLECFKEDQGIKSARRNTQGAIKIVMPKKWHIYTIYFISQHHIIIIIELYNSKKKVTLIRRVSNFG